MAASSANIREGVPITENDIKSYWKRIGKPANSFPRIYRKHNVSLVHMANVFRAITVEVASLPSEESASCWEKLQEKLEYNDKQMVEVSSIQRDERIGFQDLVKDCAAGTSSSSKAELHKGKRKARGLNEGQEEVVPGAPTVVQKKRSKKITKRRKEDTGPSGAVDEKEVCASPTSPAAKRQSLSPTPPTVHAARRSPRASLFPEMQRGDANAPAQGPSTSKRTESAEADASPSSGPKPPSESADPEPSTEERMPPEKARETTGSPVKEGGGKPSESTNVRQTAERRMSPRRPTRPDTTPSSPPPTRTEAPENSPEPGAERWTSPRRTSRHAEETANPSKSPGLPPTRVSKKVAPKERPCPSNTVPPCSGLVPSAANTCKTCGFDVKTFRRRAQEEKREKKVSAVKDTKAIIRRIKDDLMLLSEKGFQTSLVWYESGETSASLGKVERKGDSKSKEAHFLGFGELGSSWVDSDDVQKSYKRALRVYKKAKKDQSEEAKEKFSRADQSKATTPADGPPASVNASAPGSSSYILPQSLRSLVASLNMEETLRSKVLTCLESGEVDEASLRVLIDDKDWLNPMFGDKAGPRTLFKIAIKKWAENGP